MDKLVALRVFDKGVRPEAVFGVMTIFDNMTGFADADGDTEVVTVKEFVTAQSVIVTVGVVETGEAGEATCVWS